MHSVHLINRCEWQTEFDQQAQAHELQNFISDWSNSSLCSELKRYFDRICPASQTWRIDQLELDLGQIPYDQLVQELPLRLRASLQQAFERMQRLQLIEISANMPADLATSQRCVGQEADAPELQQIEATQAGLELVSWFLQHGSLPWWYRGTDSVLQIWDTQLQDAEPQSVATIRQLGQKEAVRQRIVWQLGEGRVRHLIHLLEPWQGDYICAFADEFFVLQAEQKNAELSSLARLASVNSRAFHDSTWQNILTFLLVDRGTLFNTSAFVRATLYRTAQHFHLDFAQLVQQMYLALQSLVPLGLISTPFLLAIETIYQEQHAVKAPEPAPEPDYWGALQTMLHQQRARSVVGTQMLAIDELLSALAGQDAPRMAQLLRREGQSSAVRQGLVNLLDEKALAVMVQVLQPQQHAFILAHVAHTQQALQEQQAWQAQAAVPKIVWQIVLTYLLAQGASHFERKQLLRYTLEQVCQRYDIALSVMLDQLIDAASALHPFTHRFELLQICLQIREAQRKASSAALSQHSAAPPYGGDASHTALLANAAALHGDYVAATLPATYRHSLLQYLRYGATQAQTDHANAPAGVQRSAHLILRDILVQGDGAALYSLMAEAQCQQIAADDFSQRLLQMAGAGNLAHVFELLQPEASQLCLGLIAALQHWHQQAALPALARLDLALQLPALLLQALPNFAARRRGAATQPFALQAFWQRFCTLLQQRGVDLADFAQQLRDCLQARPMPAHAQGRLAQKPVAAVGDLTPWCGQLLELLQQVGTANQPIALSQLSSAAAASAATRGSQNSLDGNADKTSKSIDTALARLLQQGDVAALVAWLQQQTDLDEVLPLLLQQAHRPMVQQCLQAQFFAPASASSSSSASSSPSPLPQFATADYAPALLLAQWSTLIRHSGYWQGTRAVLEQQLQRVFWQVIVDARPHQYAATELMAKMLRNACLRLNLRVQDCLQSFAAQATLMQGTAWQSALASLQQQQAQLALTLVQAGAAIKNEASTAQHTALEENLARDTRKSETQPFVQDHLGRYLQHPRLVDIARHLLQHGQLPTWLANGASPERTLDLTRLLFDLCSQAPHTLRHLLCPLLTHSAAMFRLQSIMPLAWLLDAMQAQEPSHASDIALLGQLQVCLERIALPAAVRQQAASALFALILRRWLAQDWRQLEIKQVTAQLILTWLQESNLTALQLQQAFQPLLASQATALQIAIQQVFKQALQAEPVQQGGQAEDVDNAASPIQNEALAKTAKSTKPVKPQLGTDKTQLLGKKIEARLQKKWEESGGKSQQNKLGVPVAVNNAGLVILQGFFVPFLSRLGLLKEGRFIDNAAQLRAAHYLQFLVTGHSQTAEHYLMLNKVLCGLPLATPLEPGTDISPSEVALAESLINSVIQYWSAIGSSSVDGFRGNWLVRNGSLVEEEAHWQLTVEKRVYDILLTRAPFSYSMIHFPWMEKALHVTWPT